MSKGSGGSGHGTEAGGGSFSSLTEEKFEDNSVLASEFDRFSAEKSNELKSRLSSKHIEAIASYAGEGYAKIRKADRGESRDPKAIETARLVNEAIAMAPKVSEVAYRGMAVSAATLKQLIAGKQISIDAVTSASRSNLTAAQFITSNRSSSKPYGVLLHLKSRSGAHTETMTGIQEEREIMIAKGTRFKIDRVRRTRIGTIKTLVIYAKEV